MRDICQEAVDAALAAGAEYADARAVVERGQQVSTKNGRVETLADAESEGIGVRVLVDGAWGFACSSRLDEAGARDAAARATGFARAAPTRNGRSLAPVEPASGSYATPVEQDPFAVSLADKIELCLRAEEAARHPGVKVTSASARALSQRKHLVTSAGADVEQLSSSAAPAWTRSPPATASSSSAPTRSAFGGSSAQAGWEYVESLRLAELRRASASRRRRSCARMPARRA